MTCSVKKWLCLLLAAIFILSPFNHLYACSGEGHQMPMSQSEASSGMQSAQHDTNMTMAKVNKCHCPCQHCGHGKQCQSCVTAGHAFIMIEFDPSLNHSVVGDRITFADSMHLQYEATPLIRPPIA